MSQSLIQVQSLGKLSINQLILLFHIQLKLKHHIMYRVILFNIYYPYIFNKGRLQLCANT